MRYHIPRDESSPPLLCCDGCERNVAACGDDHRYTNSDEIVYDNVEHEFSVYYDDVGNDEYEGEEEVYLASVISKAEVVQTGIADDGDEGLYRLIPYDCSAKSDAVLEELRGHVVNLYDEGFNDPLVTFDAAVSMMKYGDLKLRTKEREQ
jgi:hypothetical protein